MLSYAGKVAAWLKFWPACQIQAIAHDLDHFPEILMPDPDFPVMKGHATATMSQRLVADRVNLTIGKA